MAKTKKTVQSRKFSKKIIVDTLAIIFLFIGFFYALLPHATHSAVLSQFDDESSHLKHVVIGMTLVVLSLGILIFSNRKLR